MRPVDPGQLIEVDLPGHCLPADPRGLVILEQELSSDGYPAGQFKRRAVEDKQVHSRRKQDIEGIRRVVAEVRSDVYVRVGTVLTRGPAAVHVREAGSRPPEFGDSFRGHSFDRLVHAPSFADRTPNALLVRPAQDLTP